MTFDLSKAKSLAAKKIKENEEKEKNRKNFNGSYNKNVYNNTKGVHNHVEDVVEMHGKKHIIDLICTKDAEKSSICLEKGGIEKEIALELKNIKKLVDNAKMEQKIKSILTDSFFPLTETSQYKLLMQKTKAYNSTDWAAHIPTYFTNWTWEELELPLGLASMIPEVPMSSKIEEIPIERDHLFGKLAGETDTFEKQSTTATKAQMEAKNNTIRIQMYGDFLQDNLDPQIFDKQRMKTAKALARSVERAIINGDTTATHMDSSVTDPKDFRRAFNGLRKIAIDNSGNGSLVDGGGAGISLEVFQKLMKQLSPECETENLMWIMPSRIWNAIVTGEIPEVLTTQNVGSNATLISGSMFPLFGIPAYKAGLFQKDLNASGVYDGVTTDLTGMLLADKSRLVVGTRQPIRFWIQPMMASDDSLECAAKTRHTFATAPQNADEVSVMYAHNIL